MARCRYGPLSPPPDCGMPWGMDIDLTMLRTRGRAAKPLIATVVRELDEADLGAVGVEKGVQSNPLKRLSDRHHTLAKNLAGGMPVGEAAVFSGYTISRVSILQADPAFQELLEFYRGQVGEYYRDMHQRLAGLSLDAAEILADRLEESPEEVSIGQLMELTKMGADRTGFGPQTSSTNLNVNIDLATRLQAARERVAQRKTITFSEELPND